MRSMASLPAVAVDRSLPAGLRAPATIETDRLVLRRPLVSDAQAVFTRYASDPAVTRYLGWRTHRSIVDTRLFLVCCDAEWRYSGVGPYLIRSREDGQLLGSTSLRLTSPQQAATGYLLAQDAWGTGYATEALRAMRHLALRLGVIRLSAVCHPEHRASLRVMQKCGFTREGLLRAHAQFPNLSPGIASDVLCYSFIFDTEWQPLVI
jgi:RimJ/RimL family protein N-acetyltransferase